MSLVKNSTIVVMGVVISNLFAYVFHIYVGRALGPADYGVFGSLLALLMIFALPAGALSSGITKFVAMYNSKKQFGRIGLLRKEVSKRILIYSAVLFLILLVFSSWIASYLKISSTLPVIITAVSIVFAMILPINRGVLQGMKKFRSYSWNTIFESVVRLILVVVLIYLGFGVGGSLLAFGLAYLLAFLIIFPKIKETKAKPEESINMKKIFGFVFIVLAVNLVLQGIINLPTIFIKHYLSSEFTGLWTAALTLSRITLFVATGISLVMFSEVAGNEDRKKQKQMFGKALGLVVLAAVGISVIFWLVPDIFVGLLYGGEFLGASVILSWMSVAMIGISGLQLWANYWLASFRS